MVLQDLWIIEKLQLTLHAQSNLRHSKVFTKLSRCLEKLDRRRPAYLCPISNRRRSGVRLH